MFTETRIKDYTQLNQMLKGLIEDETDRIANLSNASSLLEAGFPESTLYHLRRPAEKLLWAIATKEPHPVHNWAHGGGF